jgi:isopentenyl-diphosphate delta-isomerase
MSEMVVLVDEADRPQGMMEKLEAHQKGMLHRAFSVVLLDTKGNMLLQRRASDKYHCGGLWSNACCSHPRPGEDTLAAAHRRLAEEMGIEGCLLEHRLTLSYKLPLDRGLTEHELDHVFVGVYNRPPLVNPAEVSSWKYMPVQELMTDIRANPAHYTPWFPLILEKLDLIC